MLAFNQLVARYIDRAIRPLFDDRKRNDIQVIVTVLQFDGENDPDVLAINGAAVNAAGSAFQSLSRVAMVAPVWMVRTLSMLTAPVTAPPLKGSRAATNTAHAPLVLSQIAPVSCK